MFTPYMTDAELQREAYLDYLEIRPHVRIALGQFHAHQRATGMQRSLLHSIVSTKSFRTKRGNTWKAIFYTYYHTIDNVMVGGYLVYIPIYGKRNTVDYIFLRAALKGFIPEKVTSHFVQRYKERFLEPNKINLKGMSPVVYFQRSTNDMRPTDFYPANWTEEDKKNKKVWLSNQGLFVVCWEDKMRIYITFLDQEHLTHYKAQIYEEEYLRRLFKKGADAKDSVRRIKIFSYLFSQPNAREIMKRYYNRITPQDHPDREAYLEHCMELWDAIEEQTNKLTEQMEKGIEELRKEQFFSGKKSKLGPIVGL